MSYALLPAGFHDLLYPQAGMQARIVAQLSTRFESFGYQLVEPPMVEFEEALFAGAGEALQKQTFRLMDPLSHRMMGVRADMTVQVARIARARLGDVARPLRLSYAGQVCRVKGENLYAERQLTQAGIELIGADNARADAEVAAVGLGALQGVGVQGLCIDFTLPSLAGMLLDEYGFKGETREALVRAFDKKDGDAIAKLAGKAASLFQQLVAPSLTLKEFAGVKLPKAAKPLRDRLEEVAALVLARVPGVVVSVDPLESEKFGYYNGVGFSIFSRHAKGELGRGGRYQLHIEQETVDAVGLTIYANELFRLLPVVEGALRVLLPYDVTEQEATALRAQGYVTVYALEKVRGLEAEAKRLGCQVFWSKGVLVASH